MSTVSLTSSNYSSDSTDPENWDIDQTTEENPEGPVPEEIMSGDPPPLVRKGKQGLTLRSETYIPSVSTSSGRVDDHGPNVAFDDALRVMPLKFPLCPASANSVGYQAVAAESRSQPRQNYQVSPKLRPASWSYFDSSTDAPDAPIHGLSPKIVPSSSVPSSSQKDCANQQFDALPLLPVLHEPSSFSRPSSADGPSEHRSHARNMIDRLREKWKQREQRTPFPNFPATLIRPSTRAHPEYHSPGTPGTFGPAIRAHPDLSSPGTPGNHGPETSAYPESSSGTPRTFGPVTTAHPKSPLPETPGVQPRSPFVQRMRSRTDSIYSTCTRLFCCTWVVFPWRRVRERRRGNMPVLQV